MRDPLAGVTVQVRTPEQMQTLGAAVAALVKPGDLVVLNGPLGAGKTTFVQGAARALGVVEAVTSPTFVIARSHRGSAMNLVHVDAYRLADPRDLSALDLDDELEGAVAFVEWGAHVLAGADPLAITIDRGREDDVRLVTLPPTLAEAAAALPK